MSGSTTSSAFTGLTWTASASPPRLRFPDLASNDQIVVNISGGKDSQAALHWTVLAANAARLAGRTMTVFADLRADDEWPGTAEARRHHSGWYQQVRLTRPGSGR